MFPDLNDALMLSMRDPNEPLATYSRHGFALDDAQWPSAEHYFQALRFDGELRETVRLAEHPEAARKLAQKYRRRARKDWPAVQIAFMTRAVYVKARTHEVVSAALEATGERRIVESSQYDYFWGCGRDTRGENHYGRVLMAVRERLRSEAAAGQ